MPSSSYKHHILTYSSMTIHNTPQQEFYTEITYVNSGMRERIDAYVKDKCRNSLETVNSEIKYKKAKKDTQ